MPKGLYNPAEAAAAAAMAKRTLTEAAELAAAAVLDVYDASVEDAFGVSDSDERLEQWVAAEREVRRALAALRRAMRKMPAIPAVAE